ncbi:MAG TPA: hypothetical protein VJR89_34645 [Polyangiales bacterium]|nr:hypothetical protein [Polyangiales bacterium]
MSRTLFVTSWYLAALAAAASGCGLWLPSLYPRAALAPAQRGQDLVTLLALPVFVGAAQGARLGSARAHALWLGCLGYLLYTYTGAAFAYRWNVLFLVYVALFAGCTYALVRELVELDVRSFQARLGARAPRRAVAAFLLFVAAVLVSSELAQIAAALATGSVPELIERSDGAGNFVYVLDLGVVAPLSLLAARWLWLRRPWGDVLAGLLLVKAATMGLALLSMTAFAALANQPIEPGLTLAYALVAFGAAALTARFLAQLT